MKVTDLTKLNTAGAVTVVDALQQLLADFQIFYTNLRGYHWNVKGKDFFVLHAEFEKLYNDASEKADEIAERILMLDGVPAHNFSAYLKQSKIKESGYVSSGDDGLKDVLNTYSYLIASERAIVKLAQEIDDEATVALMSDYIKEQEKLIWMLVAYYSK